MNIFSVPVAKYGIGSLHTRMIKTGAKAKVVASVWGPEFIKFLVPLAILHWDELKNRINCTKRI